MKSIRITTTLAVAALLLITCVAGTPLGLNFSPTVSAQTIAPGRKVSSDLQDAINHNPGARVKVIIQTPAGPSSALLRAARNSSGVVTRIFSNVRGTAVELPASAVAALANRSDVTYVSLDRTTHAAGHLEVTTGADQARNYGTGQTGSITGTGIGIAILDSGIYSSHTSFKTSRVRAEVDFTGEGRTNDPYGHGTHVAAAAAGNSDVSQGAYTGIAPNADILNVRVLNSAGQGSASNAIAGIDWCISNKSLYNIRVM